MIPALRGEATLLASWRALARGSTGASVVDAPDAVAAVFPAWTPLNNAIARAEPTAATHARLASRYRDAGVDAWAYWVPSTTCDLVTPRTTSVPGMTPDLTTLVMCADLGCELAEHDDAVAASVDVAARAGDEPVPWSDVERTDPDADTDSELGAWVGAWVMVRDGYAVAGVWTCLHDGDCGVYAMGTAPGSRRLGLARSLLGHALAVARQQGARTASLQSTPMAVPLYRSLGFEAFGRYEEWIA